MRIRSALGAALLSASAVVAVQLSSTDSAFACNRSRQDVNSNLVAECTEPENTWAHWTDGAGSQPWVAIRDTTGSAWPVYTAALNWANPTTGIDVIYNAGDCGGYNHCVTVSASSFEETCRQRGGFTVLKGVNHLLASEMQMVFNSKCASSTWTNAERSVITCHEFGHLLGLAHPQDINPTTTCMSASGTTFDDPDSANTGRSHDYGMIDDVIYSHND